MKYLDEFRNPTAARVLLEEIRRTATRHWTIMEVCGGQTHSLLRYGIEAALQGTVQLIHGPGCPVCVTPLESIDFAMELALREQIVLASFGDMLRVPGSQGSLLQIPSRGGRIRVVYSPLDALQWARQHPDDQVVFFAVGFETTAPATALAIKQAAHLNVLNFHMLVAHVRVQPAMDAIAMTADNQVQGFLAAGHVCSVVGYDSYQPFVEQFGLPVVVTGFEPLDLLQGILACVRQLESGVARVENVYARGVSPAGNRQAQELIAEIYETCDRQWRGFGDVPDGGLRLQARWKSFDAEIGFSNSDRQPTNAAQQCPNPCRSAEVLTGRLKPPDCPSFGTSCSPDFPLGAPMVSSEGACAAYYRYHRISTP